MSREMGALVLLCLILGGVRTQEFKPLYRTKLGIVMQPGRVISIADADHIAQEFKITIPKTITIKESVNIGEECRKATAKHCPDTLNNQTILFEGTCLAIETQEKWLDVVITKLKGVVTSIKRDLRLAVPFRNVTDRNRRGAAAEVAHYALGVGRSRDVAMNRELITVLRGTQRKMAKATESFMEQTGDQFESVEGRLGEALDRQAQLYEMAEDLNRDQNEIVHRLNSNTLALYELSVYSTHLHMLLRTKWGYVLHLMNEISVLKGIATEVRLTVSHKLSPELITHMDMMEAIENTGEYLRQNYPRFKVAFREPAFYYENSHISCYQTLEGIYIRLSLPVVSEEHIFSVYQVRAFIVPVRVANRLADGTIISGLPEEVAISRNGHYYISTPVVNWARCRGETIAICPDVPHMRKVTEHGCMAALIRGDTNAIEQVCQVDYIVRPQFPSLAVSLGEGEILISGPEIEGQLLCGSRPPVIIPIHHYSRIKLSCDCAFLTAGSWIPYSLGGCGTVTLGKVSEFVVNDILQLGTVRKLEWIKANLNGAEVDVLGQDFLPPLIRSEMEHRAAFSNSSVRIAMRKLERAIKVGRLEGERKMTLIEHQNRSAAGMGVSGTIILIIVLICCCCCCKHRAWVAAVCMPTRVDGGTLWGREEEELEVPEIVMCEGCETAMAVLSLALIVMIVLAIYLGKRLRYERRQKLPDGLYLQMANRDVSETIHLGDCAMPLDHVFQTEGTEPLIRDAAVSFACKGHVARLHWGRTLYSTELAAGTQAMPLPLPVSIKISRTMARALDADDGSIIMARLLRYLGGLASVVPTNIPMITPAEWSCVGQRPIVMHQRSGQDHGRAMAALNRGPPPEAPRASGGIRTERGMSEVQVGMSLVRGQELTQEARKNELYDELH